ncbi:MAG: SRPBCC family protein [Minicystis sp.]
MAKAIGAGNSRTCRIALRASGVREIGAGIGLLAQPQRAGWGWALVGSNVLDLALLGAAFSARRANRKRLLVTAGALLGVTALDTITSKQLSRGGEQASGRPRQPQRPVNEVITVNRSPEEVYRFWRDFQNLPQFITALESVKVTDARCSHWCARVPGGKTLEWDVEITEDRPGERIAWRSSAATKKGIAGEVCFARAPGNRGTEVAVQMGYEQEGGVISGAIGRLFGKAIGVVLAADLHRFKQILETGEIVCSDASIHLGPHAAQPPEEPVSGRGGDVRLDGPRPRERSFAASQQGGLR